MHMSSELYSRHVHTNSLSLENENTITFSPSSNSPRLIAFQALSLKCSISLSSCFFLTIVILIRGDQRLHFVISAISENRLSDRGAGDVYRVVTFVWILFGLAYLSLVINFISNVLIQKAEKMEKLTKDKLEVKWRN